MMNQILGHEIGETFTYEQIISDPKFEEHIGETATIECTVCSISRATKVDSTDGDNLSFDEIEHYYKTNELFEKILNVICENSTFYINKDHYNYYYDNRMSYFQQLADASGLTFDQYIQKNLDLNRKELRNLCKEYALHMVQVNIIAEAIISKECIDFTNDEFVEYAREQGYSQLDLIINEGAKTKIENELLLFKLKEFLISNCTSYSSNYKLKRFLIN